MRKIFQEREEKSLFTTLFKDLQLFDKEYFLKNFRMDIRTFEDLLSWVDPIIQKSSLRRSTATPAERLCVTLRYLATGDSQTTTGTTYGIRPTTMGRIISETCQYSEQFSVKRVLLKLLIQKTNGLLLLLNSMTNGISLIV